MKIIQITSRWIGWLALCLPGIVCGQAVTLDIINKQILTTGVTDSRGVTLQSASPVNHNDQVVVEKMFYLDYADLFNPNGNLNAGVIASLGTNSSLSISIYVYDPTQTASGRGDLLFRMQKTSSSATLDKEEYTSTRPSRMQGTDWTWLTNTVPYSNLKLISQGAANYFQSNDVSGTNCANYQTNFLKSLFYRRTGNFFGTQPSPCFEYNPKQPIVIELTMKGSATLKKVKLPGFEEMYPTDIWKLKPDDTYFGSELSVEKARFHYSATQGIILDTLILHNLGNESISVSVAQIKAKNLNTGAAEGTKDFRAAFSNIFNSALPAGGKYSFTLASILFSPSNSFATGLHGLELHYNHTHVGTTSDVNGSSFTVSESVKVPLGTFWVNPVNSLQAYDVPRTLYNSLPVYRLRGGLSAEYTVEKALANLDQGISHTWDVRSNNGVPDLTDGGPLSVVPTSGFLDSAVTKTVNLYNRYLGATTTFNTVIISVGLASVPYFSQAFNAPVLPVHFLVTANSIGQVRAVLEGAKSQGYSCYATAGYDPSVLNEGVAWIKLRSLPAKYKQFLIQHHVQNVLLIGADEKSIGETSARRVLIPEGSGEEYSDGSIYMMNIGEAEGIAKVREYYKDYNDYSLEDPKNIADWEGSMSDVQFINFANNASSISYATSGTSSSFINVKAITGQESVDLWQIAADIMLKYYKKNQTSAQFTSVAGVVLNEYLVGFPGWEASKTYVPFLWWQNPYAAVPTANRLLGPVISKISNSYSNSSNPKTLYYYFNNKADRSYLSNVLRSDGEIPANRIFENSYNKADIWNTSDGMTAPCELVAVDITTATGGYAAYRTKLRGLTALTFADLDAMQSASVEQRDKASTHPAPSSVRTLFTSAESCFQIRKYNFNENAQSTYWQANNYPNRVKYWSHTSAGGLTSTGHLDGIDGIGEKRKQIISMVEFPMGNTSDEYDLKIGYKFTPKREDGFLQYNATDGDEQNMGCFEFVKVPGNDWFDIPSRMMERQGATFVVNGSVYDFDYNGIPGVVPFIKKQGVIKAQPQILSFKGEGAFAWKWGATKTAEILARPKEVGNATTGAGVANAMRTLFQTATTNYPNVLAGMTYMSNTTTGQYDIRALQPTWMLNYPKFSDYYLGGASGSSTLVRCFLAYPSGACLPVIEKVSNATAPKSEGWNDCSKLDQDEFVKRFSALAYRQYNLTFDALPNARTFIGIKNDSLFVGAVDGDLGTFGPKGYALTKTIGMKNWELNNYFRYRGFTKLVNLDGGSSTQMWLNGYGPIHFTGGYPLREDNQGPYFSRLVSSFLMAVPKLHTDQIKHVRATTRPPAGQVDGVLLGNSSITMDYTPADDKKRKSYISLSPSMDKIVRDDNSKGVIAGVFQTNSQQGQGAVLFSAGEDTYYPDTKGERLVVPELRSLLVIGIGKIPGSLRDSLQHKLNTISNATKRSEFSQILTDNDQSFYVVRLQDGRITKFIIGERGYNQYIDGQRHDFFYAPATTYAPYAAEFFISFGPEFSSEVRSSYTAPGGRQFLDTGPASNYCYIGAVNVDGRYITGNTSLLIYDFFIAGARSTFSGTDLSEFNQQYLLKVASNSVGEMSASMISKMYGDDVYLLQFRETAGQHVFAASDNGTNRLYGLKLNVSPVAEIPARKAVEETAEVEHGVTVYPNPTDGILNVDFTLEQASKVNFELHSLAGVKVFEQQKRLAKGEQHVILDISRLKTGAATYVLTITDETGKRIASRNIVVE